MASHLPAFPRFVFTAVEPVSLVAGFIPAVFSPDWFLSEQIPGTTSAAPTDNARLVAQQLGNCYGLAFLVGIAVLYTSSEIRVVRNYLKALWLADIGHLAVTYYVLQHDRFVSVIGWNPMTWGNVGATLFLFLTRTAYFVGLFGQDMPSMVPTKKLQ